MGVREKLTPVLMFVGLLAVAGAMLYAVAPSVLPDEWLETAQLALGTTDPEQVALALGAGVGLYAYWTARKESVAVQPPVVTGDPPEKPVATKIVGESIDQEIHALAVGLANREKTRADVDALRSDLQEITIELFGRRPALSQQDAEQVVYSGEWTENETAAAFLADADGPTFSLLKRIRWWLLPEKEFKRRLRATVSEIRQYYRTEHTTVPAESAQEEILQ